MGEKMDTTFVKYIEEIEKLYIHLPKPQRVRVEKWVEKLVSIGSNVVWRKHRNAYTKLLLNNVVSKNLTEPFNLLPPDGPLPSYPFHIKPITKDLLGIHETTFWRDLYSRLQEQDTRENNSFSYHPYTSSPAPPSSSSNQGKNKSLHSFGDNPMSREIDNLQRLIKEQEQRILLLEQQLHEERVKRELQIQRINYSHRMEIHQLLTATTAGSASETVTNDHQNLPSFLSNRDSYQLNAISPNKSALFQNTINRSRSPFLSQEKRASHYDLNTGATTATVAASDHQIFSKDRLYQSYPNSNHTQPLSFHSGSRNQVLSNLPTETKEWDFNATLRRSRPPVISTEEDHSFPTATNDASYTQLEGNYSSKQLFEFTRSRINAEENNQTKRVEDESNGSRQPIDIIPGLRKPSPTSENISLNSIEPNVSHIVVSQRKASEFLSEGIGVQNEAAEVQGEERLTDEILSKDSSDEEFLSYIDKFQQQIQEIKLDTN